jgi:lysozyme family protein
MRKPNIPERQMPVIPNSKEGLEMAAFQKSIDFTLKHEGGYVNHSKDPGGETKFGISKKAYPKEDIANLTKERATEIYKQDYWTPIKAAEMPEPIAMLAFDMAVNHGVGRAAKLLQQVVGAKADGHIGSKSLAKIKQVYNQNPMGLIDSLVEKRRAFYQSLKTYETFGRGWEARAIASSDAAKETIGI